MTAQDLNRLAPAQLIEHYLDRAWTVIPAKDKRPVGSWKHSQTIRPNARQRDALKRHVEKGGDAFLVCGEASSVAVLDLDSQAAVRRWRDYLGDDWPRIPKARTPRRGYHLFFAASRAIESQKGEDWDLQANGKGVVLPSGNGGRSWEVPPGDVLPDFALIAAHVKHEARKQVQPRAGEPIAQGARDDALTSLAGAMRRAGMGESAILAALSVENAERCNPPLADADVQRIARSVARYATGRDAEIEKEVERLRVRDEARRRYLAESAVTGSRDLLTLEDAERAAAEPIDWVIPELLAAGDKAVIAGPPKSLKTWFALNLVHAVASAGRPCEHSAWAVPSPQSALFVQEEGTHQRWAHRLMAVTEGNPDAPIRYAHRTGVSLLNAASVAWLIEQGQAIDARVIVLDPLQRITPGVNENDASEVGPAWDAIHKIASDTGAAVVVLHHARKGNGEPTMDSIRGSSRVAGEVDLMFVLRRVERGTLELYLEGRDLPPRSDGEHGNLAIKYDPEAPHRMRLDGPRIVVKGPANRTRPAVERVLRDAGEPLPTSVIVQQVKRDRSNVTRALNELHADGHVRKTDGRGKALMWEWIGA